MADITKIQLQNDNTIYRIKDEEAVYLIDGIAPTETNNNVALQAISYGRGQALTEEQKTQARENIGAASVQSVLDVLERIPTTIPNPHKLTFTGAANAEYDGSEAVNINIPSSEATITEVIAEMTLEEDVSEVSIACSPLEYKKILMTITIKPASADSQLVISTVTNNGVSYRELLRLLSPAITQSQYGKTSYVQWDILPARAGFNDQFLMGASVQNTMCCNITRLYQTDASAIKFKSSSSEVLIPAGSTFLILGVK